MNPSQNYYRLKFSEEYYDLIFISFLQRFRENASVKNELWNLTETLMSDLELCKQENEELRNQLNDVLNKDNTFSDLYSDLEGTNFIQQF